MHTTILTADDVSAIVRHVGLDALMDRVIDELDRAFRAFDPQHTVVPTRAGFQYESPALGLIEWMPSMRVGDSAHIKVVGYHPYNGTAHELPTILSTMSLYDVRDGHLKALMDATFVTALRTGAASAIASRLLTPADASELGLIGAGAQAITQLHALSRIFPLRRVFIHDTDPSALQSFRQRIACLGLDQIEIIDAQPAAFLERVDILCTATSVDIGGGPVFEPGNTRAHLHINAVGSDFPGKTEIPKSLLDKALVCPDFAGQAAKEGECQLLEPGQIGPELHELLKRQPQDHAQQQSLTVFDSTGWAIEDMVCMEIFLDYARQLQLGSRLALETLSSDHRNPYHFLSEERSAKSPADPLREVV